MKTRRVAWLGAVLLTAAAALYLSVAPVGAQDSRYRWDIVSVNFATGAVSAGGIASAFANDGSKITLKGSGTFRSNPGSPQGVTGGGTWAAFAPGGAPAGSGTYRVTRFVSFIVAPGTPPVIVPPAPIDNIGDPADARAGLLVVRILYSDGSTGVLTVSCHLVGTPDMVFEGITATKGFVDYWNREAPPAPPGDANRTVFHVLG